MPDLTRANACAAVIAGGHVVIIDAGPGSWSKLAAVNMPAPRSIPCSSPISTPTISAISAGSRPKAGSAGGQCRSRSMARRRPKARSAPPTPRARPSAPPAPRQVVKGFAEAYNADAEFRIAQGHELVRPGRAHDRPRRPEAGPEEAVTVYDKDGLEFEAFLVNHNPAEPAYGYRIDYGGRAAVISGDTTKVRNMVRFSKAPTCSCIRR